MDFGGLDGLMERSLSTTAQNQDEWRDMKVAKMSNSLYSDSQNMLSFSSPYTQQTRNTTGFGMRGVIAGVRGPFTPSQWMELEHQALIYKYITVNAPIPSNLLIPIRKALETAAYSSYPGTNLRQAAYGWGGFHFGFSNNSDPEPGRCRRTDGKKWRCSRDAVADQKYCERHMNRGRHRSRKPVEGQAGHSVSNGPTNTPTAIAAAAKVSASAAVVANATTTSTILSHLPVNPSAYSHSGNMLSPSTGLKPSSLSAPSEFGLVCSDSLLNPLSKTDNLSQKPQNSLRQFMDDWPHSDRTQLSISIPVAPSDFMSSSSSPVNEKRNLSPLRMGLGVSNTNNNNNVFNERSQVNWIPVSWETSMGGPLGEALKSSTNTSPSALNLMTDGWESSQQTTLSPTGVLQKNGFGSVSNSSAGSSPRADNSLLGSTFMASTMPLL
nr:growth-regulating factor 6-like isoform X1 [Tanacetum cinerariifolium]